MNNDPMRRKNGMNGHSHKKQANGYAHADQNQNYFHIAPKSNNPMMAENTTSTNEPSMDWVENLGLFVLRDCKVIQRENRQFCMRMIDFLTRSRKTRLAHLDLDRHELVVQFSNPLTTRAHAANILGDAIRLASMPVELGSDFRSRSHWSGFTSFVSDQGLSTYWYSRELGPGRLSIYGKPLKETDITSTLLEQLIPSMKSVHKRLFSRGLNIQYDAKTTRPLDLVGAIDTICRLEASRVLPEEDENPLASISLPIRVWHLSLAVFSFGGAIVGLVVPGIPTVPFILLTSYHLAKGSTRIHHFFLRLPLFGSVAHDWSDGKYIRPVNKMMLIVLTAGIITVTLILTQVTTGLLITVGTVFFITTWSVLATPSYPQSGVVPKVGISRGLRALPGLS